MFIGGIAAIILGLVRKTDGRSPEPVSGDYREG
jgi:hypothetical protein